MPWIDEKPTPQPVMPTGTAPPNPIRPGVLDVVGAAFRQENPLVSVARRLWDGFYAPEPGHNPLQHIAGTMFEERYLDRFIGSQSAAETFDIMRRIQGEEEDRKTLDAAGFGGTVAQIAAGTLDPTLALPGGVIVRGARGGYSVMKSAGSVAGAAALASSVSETALQLTHETRTIGESGGAIASATILGGLIGAGAARLLSRAERTILEESLDRTRAEMDFHNGLAPEPPAPSPRAEGIAQMDAGINQLMEQRFAKGWIKVPEGEMYVDYGGGQVTLSNLKFEIKGTGAFTEYLNHLENRMLAGDFKELKIENIHNERLIPFLQDRGYAKIGGEPPSMIANKDRLEIIGPHALNKSPAETSGARGFHWSPAQFDQPSLTAGKKWMDGEVGYMGNGVYLAATPENAGLYRDLAKFKDANIGDGHLYTGEVTADPGKIVDFDKPFAEQSPFVQEQLRPMLDAQRRWFAEFGVKDGPDPATLPVKDLADAYIHMNNLAEGLTPGYHHVVPWMRERGVQAIRHTAKIDTDTGQVITPGDIVVFDQGHVRFTHRDGSPLAPDAATGLPSSIGAAVSDTRALELETSGLGWTAPISPTRFVLSSESQSARRTMADLAETPYRFIENTPVKETIVVNGQQVVRERPAVATTQGPALDRLARTQINGTRVAVSDKLEELFSQYRFGPEEKMMPRASAWLEDIQGAAPDRLSYGDFKREVAKALQEGDTHAVPQVAAAAQFIRNRVFTPWKDRAVAAGLLPEGVDVKTAESYFQRVYNKERIRAERPEFVTKVTDWLRSDQTKKAAAKDRITALNDELQGFEAAIAKANSEESAASLMARRDVVRAKIEEEIAAWEGKSVADAKAALKAREAYEATRNPPAEGAEPPSRLTQADSAVDRAVRRIIESDRDLSDAELRDRAQEITGRILGSPDGRLPYDIPMGGPEIGWKGPGGEPPRGPLAAREFNIPDQAIRDYLEDDVETVVAMHLRTMVPDVMLTERFGDVRMTEAFKKVEEDYARLTDAATSQKERVRLGKERDGVIERMAAVRDRIRGVYGWSDGMRNMARVAAGAKVVNNLTSMGVAAISSLPDMAGVVLRHGLSNAFNDGWRPFFSYLTGQNEGWAKFKTQMRAVGIGIETATNARQNALDDVTDVYRPGSRFERGLQMVNDRFFIANLLAPLTDVQKSIAAHVSVSEILRTSKKAAEGKASAKELANLAESGIDQQMAGRIWAQFQTGGEVMDGVHLPNTADWTDKAAADALNGAVSREVDIAVVTPGQEKSLWLSHPVLSVLGQFKSFVAASTERILVANLMRRDAHALNGVMLAVALGMISYKLNSFFGGQETSKRPADWVKEGVSRGGLLGWIEEANAMAAKMTRGGADVYRLIGADKPLSRFASRSTLDMLLGPTAAKIEGLSKVSGAAASGDWTAADTTALRRLVAFQNLAYIRGLINQAEGGFNQMLGVPPRAEPENRR